MAATEIIKKTYAPTALVGQLYAKVYGSAAPYLPIGNALGLEIKISEKVEKQADMTRLGGGTHAEIRRVEAVEFSAELADLNPINLARALQGGVTAVDAGTVTDAEYVAALGGLLPLPHAQPTAVVLKKGETTIDAEDYEVRPEGIWLPDSVAGLANGDTVKVSYSYGDQVVLEALTTKAAELSLRFAGLNEANGGRPVLVDIHRASQGVTKQLGLIQASGFASLSVEGAVLKDPAITAVGASPYFKVGVVG